VTRAYYRSSIRDFLLDSPKRILGELVRGGTDFATIDSNQVVAWEQEIDLLRQSLSPEAGAPGDVFLEYAVPRLGRRIDAVLILRGIVFVIEFKVGACSFTRAAIDQVWDYALDLKNFHETSHARLICPVLVATGAMQSHLDVAKSKRDDGVLVPIRCGRGDLPFVIETVASQFPQPPLEAREWDGGRYLPTPTIVEAALALYAGHGVAEISRSDASAVNLSDTSASIEALIESCRTNRRKAICFVTGVPGAGKTLVGLNVATRHAQAGETHSVFLSGNGPLVAVLREALARDQVLRAKNKGERLTKAEALTQVKAFIQNVHHFRDEYLKDPRAPADHVAVFDEAQRAWNREQTAAFMQRKRGQEGFALSEPEFLVSCMDRHEDWAVIVCLVGGGQEINTGEAGISGWLEAVLHRFPHWEVHVSTRLQDPEYGVARRLSSLPVQTQVQANEQLHLRVSLRSFRAEHLSDFIKHLLSVDVSAAREALGRVLPRYPIVLCRSVESAKQWVRQQARGSERFGLLVSSRAERLRPHGIHVRAPMDPVHWFLDEKDDVRSAFYLEDVATEFHVQGLELDWSCVVWDGDLRRTTGGWSHHCFIGNRWTQVRSGERQTYQTNAYRVLLTRARQGMVIVVPDGDEDDVTRHPDFYDPTFRYLRELGIPEMGT